MLDFIKTYFPTVLMKKSNEDGHKIINIKNQKSLKVIKKIQFCWLIYLKIMVADVNNAKLFL